MNVPIWLGILLFVVGLSGVLFTRVRSGVNGISPFKFGNPMVLPIILLIVGFLVGGAGATWDMLQPATAVITGDATQNLDAVSAQTMLQYCTYSAGVATSTGASIRTDPYSQNRVFVDLDESAWNVTNAAGNEANISFTCKRTGGVDKAGAVYVVADGNKFFSENSVSDSTEYDILERTTSPSIVWNSKPTQTVYLADGAYASTSSNKEQVTLTFAEGVAERSLGVRLEADFTAYGELNNYTQKDVNLYQRVGNSDTKIATVTFNKIP